MPLKPTVDDRAELEAEVRVLEADLARNSAYHDDGRLDSVRVNRERIRGVLVREVARLKAMLEERSVT